MQVFAWHFKTLARLHDISKGVAADHGRDEGEEEDSGVEERSIRVD